MGQKVNANGLRIGISRGWNSTWYADKKEYATLLQEDVKIRRFLEPKLKDAMLSHIEIGRVKTDKGYRVQVSPFVARPGVVLGQDGANVKALREGLQAIVKSGVVDLKVVEVRQPDLDATLVAKWIAGELENRQSFRSTQKKAMQRMRKAGAVGCRTQCQGRLGGAEIARRGGYKQGVVPLETLRADIDFASVPAYTTYGQIGIKVWICRSTNKDGEAAKEPKAPREQRQGGMRDNAAAKAR